MDVIEFLERRANDPVTPTVVGRILILLLAEHRKWAILLETENRSQPLGPDVDNSNFLKIMMTRRYDFVIREDYKARFGVNPPIDPLLYEIAKIWQTHPEYEQIERTH